MSFEILIVDDDCDIRDAIAECFSDLPNVTLSKAANGHEALQMFADRRVDLIITDVQMPLMNGMELIRAVLSASGAKPKIFVMSGFSPYPPAELLQLGASAFFDKTDILALVKAAKAVASKAA